MRHRFALLVLAALAPGAGGQDGPERGLVSRADGAFDGYTLFAPLRSTTTYLVDMDGEVVHTWESEHFPGNSVYLMDDGNLLRACRMKNDLFEGGGQGGRIQELTWEGTLVWDFAFNDEAHMHHHDYEPLPDGNLLLIAWEARTKQEAFAAGRDPEHIGPGGLWPDFVVEIEPVRPDGGRVVWEWHAWDHVIQDFNAGRANFGDVTAHPELIDVNGDHREVPPLSAEERKRQEELEEEMRALGYVGDDDDGDQEDDRGGRGFKGDWLHTNSIAYVGRHDLILLSARRFHEVWVIDHATTTAEAASHSGGRRGHGGDLLYRWGNPRAYGRGTEADQTLFGQHDARWIASQGDLRLQVFNNGDGRSAGDFSSVDEIVLPFHPERGFASPAAAAFGPSRPAWSYTAPDKTSFFSSFISGAERLANGNTLVCSGAQGRLFEVTRAGQVVWEYLNPFGEEKPGEDGPRIPKGLFRATRLPADHPGLARL